MNNLKGKTALITGAGKGIGRAIALALAAESVNLALVGRTLANLQNVAEEVRALNPAIKICIVRADISNLNDVVSAAQTIRQEIGKVDILVNNAGTAQLAKFLDLEVEAWENIVRTNLFGTYYVIRQILPQMLERQEGDIINIASTAGLKGAPVTSAYSASKFGLIGLSESLMLEVRKSNIRVFTLMPSTVGTELSINNKLTDGNPETTLQPEDLAEVLIAHLKLPRRALIKDVSIWSTNP
ncbi:3-ketoacyl-ACP reductase [Mucilaginibacter sp. CAU 1740]|uniref:3-ketoacyl-ACP reductase n=1 Tax=Mucilaginibacter sp. CAU 1740 TaxID=3140365 RepID=UPI00325C32B8